MERLEEAFRDFITGRGAERAKLDLIHEGLVVVDDFLGALQRLQFTPTTVAEVPVDPGERVPAFYIKDSTAFFGWVFWEKFKQIEKKYLYRCIFCYNSQFFIN